MTILYKGVRKTIARILEGSLPLDMVTGLYADAYYNTPLSYIRNRIFETKGHLGVELFDAFQKHNMIYNALDSPPTPSPYRLL